MGICMDRMNICAGGGFFSFFKELQQTDGQTFSLSIGAWHRKHPAGHGQRPPLSGLNHETCSPLIGRLARSNPLATHHPAFRRLQGLDADGLVALSLDSLALLQGS